MLRSGIRRSFCWDSRTKLIHLSLAGWRARYHNGQHENRLSPRFFCCLSVCGRCR
jgi:hypothetical protein